LGIENRPEGPGGFVWLLPACAGPAFYQNLGKQDANEHRYAEHNSGLLVSNDDKKDEERGARTKEGHGQRRRTRPSRKVSPSNRYEE